jgi:hypothetical protein
MQAKIAKFANGQINLRAVDERTTVCEKLAALAMRFLGERDFARALDAIDAALSGSSSPLFNICRAHALMFLDRTDEAKALYLRYRDERVDDHTTGAALILHDFDVMRGTGLSHSLMDEVAGLLASKNVAT